MVNPPPAVNNARTDDQWYVSALSLSIITILHDILICVLCYTCVATAIVSANHVHSLTVLNRTLIKESKKFE